MAYTYLIGWSALGLWYYGVRYARGCSVSDLWKTYFTSSLEVKRMRGEYGEPDVVEVRRVFDDPAKAREWEDRVLRRTGAVKSPRWINASNGGHEFAASGPHSPEHRAKISAAQKRRLSDPAVRAKAGLAFLGKQHSNETRAKISATKKGKPLSAEHCAKVSASMVGRTFSDEARAKISAAKTGKAFSDEHRKNMSAVRLGKQRKPHSDETRAKMKAAWELRRNKASALKEARHV